MLLKGGYIGDVQNTRFRACIFSNLDDLKRLLPEGLPLCLDEYLIDGDPEPIALIHAEPTAYKTRVSPRIPTAEIDGIYRFLGPAVVTRASREDPHKVRGLSDAEISGLRSHIVLVQSKYTHPTRLKTWEILGDVHTFPEARHLDI